MIRKFFAFQLLVVFVLIVPPMLITESIVVTFLDKSSVKERVIPGSYEAATALLAEQFSRDPADIRLFSDRIRAAIPREVYSELLAGAADIVFETVESAKMKPENTSLTADLTAFKEKLKTRLPEIVGKLPECASGEKADESFRFCRPSKLPSGANFKMMATDILEKEVPLYFTIGSAENPKVAQYVRSVLLAKRIMPSIFAVISLAVLGMIALLVFSPLSLILRWLGAALLSLLTLVVLFLFSLSRLPKVVPIFEGLSPAQVDLINFFVNQITSKLSLWIFFVGAAGILLFGSGILLRTKKHSSKK